MKGNITVELFDTNQEKRQMVKSSNFVGTLAKKLMFNVGASAIARYAFRNGKVCGGLNAVYCFDKLSLTDNTEPVNTDALILPGNEIGWSNYETYAGTDTTRGTINTNETIWCGNTLKLVFDFGTDKANGTFQTLGFKANTPRYNFNLSLATLSDVTAYTYADNHIFAYTNGHIYKLDPATLTLVEDIPVPYLGNMNGLVYLDGEFYANEKYNDYFRIYQLNTETNTWDLMINQYYNRSYHYGLCTDGTYLYSFGYSTYRYIYRVPIDFSTDVEVISMNISNLEAGVMYSSCHIYDGKFTFFTNNTLYGLDINDLFESSTYNEVHLLDNVDAECGNQPLFINNNLYGTVSNISYYSMFESSTDSGYARGEGYDTSADGIFCKIPTGKADLGTCVVLPTAVTKNDTQTMKITYTFTFNG